MNKKIKDNELQERKNIFSNLKYVFKFEETWKRYILFYILFALLVNIVIIYLNPISIHPDFIANNDSLKYLDILLKLILNTSVFISIGVLLLFFKSRIFLTSLYSIIWIGLSLANSILIEIRNNPLTKSDFTMISEGVKLSKTFFNNTHYIKIILFIIFSFAIILLSLKLQRKPKEYKFKNISLFSTYILLFTFCVTPLFLALGNKTANNYSQFGFVYAFSKNISTPEIKKPKSYNSSTMKAIKKEIDETYNNNKSLKEKPNIIAIQLESFFDIKTVDGLSLSENPTPYFDKLSSEFTSGLIKVPTVGGGTARSEFEFITGFNLDYMQEGVIPHNSFLKRGPYFSSIYALKKNGYKTHLLHNFAGYFYNRDIVYNNLGFDTFISLEFLNNASDDHSIIKASRDNIFPNEIKKLLASTSSADFIFGITTQLHGNYEENYNEFENNIRVNGNFDKIQLSQFNDYANELKSIDNVIKDIIKEVESLNEPSVIIFYSDHMPPLSFKDTNIKGEGRYLVPYVVWDNIGLKKESVNLNCYELLSKYMNLSGTEGNYLNKLQSIPLELNKKESYQELIQYDISTGKNYIKETLLPYKINTKLGLNDIVIESVSKKDITYTIKGSGFTSSMVLVVDEAECGISFIDESTISFTTNLNLEGKDIYFKIRIGKNENSVAKSNIFTVKNNK